MANAFAMQFIASLSEWVRGWAMQDGRRALLVSAVPFCQAGEFVYLQFQWPFYQSLSHSQSKTVSHSHAAVGTCILRRPLRSNALSWNAIDVDERSTL